MVRRDNRKDVKEKVDTVIEGYNLLSGKIDRLAKQNVISYHAFSFNLRKENFYVKNRRAVSG
jgi:hypothetical protein